MKIQQVHIKKEFTADALASLAIIQPDLIMAFGDVRFFEDLTLGQKLRQKFPKAIVIGCSTAGEIVGDAVYDGTLVLTALAAKNCEFFLATAKIADASRSREAGEVLGRQLVPYKLKAALILAPGLNVNGSDLVSGLSANMDKNVVVTGGLAGDGGKFHKTYTLFNETVATDTVVALGSKGSTLDISYGSQGGWQPFGPERRVTKAVANILYELDGKSALQLYKEYLGDKAKDLPASGLLYPFAVLKDDLKTTGVIRTILNIDEKAGSLILAGNIHEGSTVRLMHAQAGGLIGGASMAGMDACASALKEGDASLGLLVSCVGRKLVMGDDVDEEVGVVKTAFGNDSFLTGFYSYGEICPLDSTSRDPHLHNQTMTVTRFGQSS